MKAAGLFGCFDGLLLVLLGCYLVRYADVRDATRNRFSGALTPQPRTAANKTPLLGCKLDSCGLRPLLLLLGGTSWERDSYYLIAGLIRLSFYGSDNMPR